MSDTLGCYKGIDKCKIRMRSGRYFDIENPDIIDFKFTDIACALSRICRYGAHTSKFYSVAEHLIHCEEQARLDGYSLIERRAVFSHDFGEALIGDVVKPLKNMLQRYEEIEEKVDDCIAQKFLVNFRLYKDRIKKIDTEMLIAEKKVLFPPNENPLRGADTIRVIYPNIQCWKSEEVEEIFINKAKELNIEITI